MSKTDGYSYVEYLPRVFQQKSGSPMNSFFWDGS